MATTITLLNMKGGVGKTTLAVNLAWHMFRLRSARVLLVDLDPQFNASQSVMTFDEWEEHRKKNGTTANLLLDAGRARMPLNPKAANTKLQKMLYKIEGTKKCGFYLLPAELDLAHAIKNPQGVEFRLSKSLEQIQKDFDYIFIDSSPTNTVLTATALMASDYAMVPMRPDRFSILGYSLIQEVLDDFRSTYPDPKTVTNLGMVFTFVSRNPSKLERSCKTKVRAAAKGSYILQGRACSLN